VLLNGAIIKMRDSYIRPFGRILFLLYCCLAALFTAQAQVNVTTFHNDNARDGQNIAWRARHDGRGLEQSERARDR